jgi:hypothetical protein
MGILGAAAIVVALAGCYSPSLRDCTVSCSNEHDCAAGQVCGADGMCAAPDMAGHCDVAEMPDAAMPGPDAPATDVIIHVHVMGKGTVTVNQTACNAQSTMPNDCMIPVPPAVPATIKAIDGSDTFAMWASTACAGQGATCILTPIAPVTDVAAKFMKGG